MVELRVRKRTRFFFARVAGAVRGRRHSRGFDLSQRHRTIPRLRWHQIALRRVAPATETA
jgi:hypothetical protein